LPRDFFV